MVQNILMLLFGIIIHKLNLLKFILNILMIMKQPTVFNIIQLSMGKQLILLYILIMAQLPQKMKN